MGCPSGRRAVRRRKTKGAPSGAPFAFLGREARMRVRSQRVVHFEFDRMWRHLEALDFGHLQLDIAVDKVVVEDAAVLEEGAILVEVLQRLTERAAHRRNRFELFLRKIVEVLVHRRTWIELVLDAVETG